MELEQIVELVKKSYYKKMSLNKTVINNSPYEEDAYRLNFFFEFPIAPKVKNLFEGMFELVIYKDVDSISLYTSIPNCFSVNDGKVFLRVNYNHEKEHEKFPLNEIGIAQAVDHVCDRYISIIGDARKEEKKYKDYPSFEIEDGITCKQLATNFMLYTYNDCMMTVYQEHVIMGKNESIDFVYNIYKKTFNNRKAGGTKHDEHSYLLFPDLLMRAQ